MQVEPYLLPRITTVPQSWRLAVVWAMQHFKAYLYSHEVTVVTDHSAVKAILQMPNLSGKYARWWLKVFGSGVKKIDIVY